MNTDDNESPLTAISNTLDKVLAELIDVNANLKALIAAT
jgi:hypothetical protein